jgi:hypothetical protein
MPTVMKIGGYRFFFNSREEKRCHIHIAAPDGVAKFWLEPIVALASYHNLPVRELRKIEDMVKENENEFRTAWDRHFSQ